MSKGEAAVLTQISDSELELMQIIWEEGGTALYARIMERLAENGRGWQKNTVITLLSRLVEKGLLRTSKIGRRNRYTALASREDYQAAQTQSLVNKLYQGSARGLVATLLQREMLSAEDCKELREFWEKAGEET